MTPEPAWRFEITAPMNRQEAEEIQLEIRRLARAHGVAVERVRVEKAQDT